MVSIPQPPGGCGGCGTPPPLPLSPGGRRIETLLRRLYPRDFLKFVEKMPLQPEPEIFIKADEFEVILPEMLTAASEEYCPRGLWSRPRVHTTHALSRLARSHRVPLVPLSRGSLLSALSRLPRSLSPLALSLSPFLVLPER